MYAKRLCYGYEDMLQNEFKVLQQISMRHPNILTLIDYFETEDYIYYVTDLAKGGELFHRIIDNGSLEESSARQITAGILKVIAYLHDRSIVHRDLKAENILFQSKNPSKNQILLADFGLATIVDNGPNLLEVCGTLSYISPEILNRQPDGYGLPIDIWAIGVIVYFMLCGYMPFDCETDEETKTAITSCDYLFEPPEYWNHISVDAKDFIRQCFILDPKLRPTARDLLEHPFVTGKLGKPSKAPEPVVQLLSPPNSGSSTMMIPSRSSECNDHEKLKEALTNILQPNHNSAFMRVPLQQGDHIHHSSSGANLSRLASATNLLKGTSRESSTSQLNQMRSLANIATYLELSRRASLREEANLRGGFCSPPELVSRFTTPINSTFNSRENSYESMSFGKLAPLSLTPPEQSKPTFFV
ncbi:uncharacterized protein KQ657_004862 [Scheffersomyces spartinae]|uniref:Protein kinase domain-containing protein n=1 Tax=Scheffersomyces spartinae TaxID=45513 RepID=A0A9P7VB68_9ASCO|nr:uncharacterized protein KQ657_004862 [Scheffersomyces spartinae]KAG7194154.1 hypothetical protein KQ657_004862 [Scheffersomyces spartinae]